MRSPPKWWRRISVGLGATLGLWTLVIAVAYLVADTRRAVWASPQALREALGILLITVYGMVILAAALARSSELRAALLFGASMSVFVIGLFAGANLDVIVGLLGLPALAGVLAAAFALVESRRWWRAGAYSLICSVSALGLLWLYSIVP